MSSIVLFDDGNHRNLLMEDFGLGGLAVQANQHLIVNGEAGLLLDPGGHKVYSKVLAEATMARSATPLLIVAKTIRMRFAPPMRMGIAP